MPKTIRLTKNEEKLLTDKCIELNKVLINNNKAPIRDSELVHLILEDTISGVKINKKGDFVIFPKNKAELDH